MRWVNHKGITLIASWSITHDLVFSTIAAVSSVLPDVIEMGAGKFIFKRHRGVSHTPLLWLVLLSGLYLILYIKNSEISALKSSTPGFSNVTPAYLCMAVTVGICSHLFIDALSVSGIPVWGRTRLALKLYRTFTVSEFIVAALLAICSIFTGYILNGGFPWK